MKAKSSADRRRARRSPSLMECIQPNAAGIDCGSEAHFVAVPPDRDPEPIQSFGTYTVHLNRLADWLQRCGVTTVAMEATGVYWIALYELLEERGLTVILVNARHVKNVPGRKSDVLDCEWLRQLHSVGLLRGSFRPTQEIVALRGYTRHRDSLVQTMSDLVRRMQKALIQMNVQLSVVLTDIMGVTGQRILRDIAAGRTDPASLVKHRDPGCKASPEEFVAALTGNWRAEGLFALKQTLTLYDVYQGMLKECDVAIENHLRALTNQLPAPSVPLAPRKGRVRTQGNEPHFDVRHYLHHLAGADLSAIDALGPYTGLRLIAEIGTDMSRWPTERHFTSWLTLAPHNRISGGRLLSSRTPPSANRAATMLRLVALSLSRTQTALGAFYRRIAPRIGKPKAITAVARKLAVLIYRTLRGEITYADPGPETYNAAQRDRALRRLVKRAQTLGFALVDLHSGEALSGVVS